MRKLIVGGIFFVWAVLMSGPALAQEGKISVVDVRSAILQTDLAKSESDKMRSRADFKDLLAQYQTLQSELKALSEQMQRDGITMNDAQKRDLLAQATTKQTEMQAVAEQIQVQEQSVIAGVMQALEPVARKALEEIVDEQNISLLFKAEAIYHSNNYHNVTRALTTKLNEATN